MPQQYGRILLKISGEALMGSKDFGLDTTMLYRVTSDIATLIENNIEVGVVIGGGNICRGARPKDLAVDRITGDQIGMLGTAINALVLKSRLEAQGFRARIQSAVAIRGIVSSYNRTRAIQYLSTGHAVIFCGGIGHPFFTTDTAAVLRAIETKCDIVVKYTQVNGVYSADPRSNKDAVFYNTISHDRVIRENLAVMDLTAIALAQENKLPLMVCNIHSGANILEIMRERSGYTIIA